jgi:hypothetical protein
VKALKRKFAARENEQPEEQEAQRSSKRALVADMDDVSESPRILSCQRWRVLPSPLGAHNQQVQTGEGAAGPKAPTPAAPASHQPEPDMLEQIRRLGDAATWGAAAPEATTSAAQAPPFGQLFGLFDAAAGPDPGPAVGPGPGVGSAAAAAAAAAGSAPSAAAAAAAGEIGDLRLHLGGAALAPGPAV